MAIIALPPLKKEDVPEIGRERYNRAWFSDYVKNGRKTDMPLFDEIVESVLKSDELMTKEYVDIDVVSAIKAMSEYNPKIHGEINKIIVSSSVESALLSLVLKEVVIYEKNSYRRKEESE
jgi:hypothetical protein